jgi:hypothetical protein
MKKIICVVLILSFVLISGCVVNPVLYNDGIEINTTETYGPEIFDTEEYAEEIQITEPSTSDNSNSNIDSYTNPFFFANNISHVSYGGYTLTDTYHDIYNAILYITEIEIFKNGRLYELKFDLREDDSHLLDYRDFLGYFYVQENNIYKITPYDFQKLLESGSLDENAIIDNSEIVCQITEFKDPLREDEKGWHHYIEVDGDTITSHGYSTLTETGYYERFVWERHKGLTFYLSGYGAEREHMELTQIMP